MSSVAVWSCDTGKINVYDKIVIKNKNNGEYRNQKNFYLKLHHKDGLGMEFTAC